MASYDNPESAPKPANFEALCAAWADPMQWAAQVALYNDQVDGEGLTAAPVAMGREHSKHVAEHNLGFRYRDDGTVD